MPMMSLGDLFRSYNDRIRICEQSRLNVLEQKEVYVLLTK